LSPSLSGPLRVRLDPRTLPAHLINALEELPAVL
jgi:hypothetical protein